MKFFAQAFFSVFLSVAGATASLAQGANISLGTPTFDVGQPVEVSADSLSVDQGSGEAVFDGNVLVVQGDVRMSAGRIRVVPGIAG